LWTIHIVAVLLLASTCIATAASPLVGLAMVENGPAKYKLVSVNATSGVLEFGDDQEAHEELAGTGDLCAIDKATGVFYYLGDTSAGTTLVGLSTEDGSELCSSTVTSLMEIGIVGAGQSLDFDSSGGGSLVLSGVSTNETTKHAVLRLFLGDGAKRALEAKKPRNKGGGVESSTGFGLGGGADFETVGTFGDDAYLPFVHSSAIDSAGQRFFVTLQPGDDEVGTNSLAIGVVDISGTGMPYYTIPMDFSSKSSEILYGIDWDSAQSRLVGAIINEQNTGLSLRAVIIGSDASTDPVWSEQAIEGTPSTWKYLGGNSATVSTLDETGRLLYFQAGNNAGMNLVAVDVDTAQLVAHPALSGDMPIGSSGLTMMDIAS